jgi:hypothetical protein
MRPKKPILAVCLLATLILVSVILASFSYPYQIEADSQSAITGQVLTVPDVGPHEGVGDAVAVSGDTAIIGAFAKNSNTGEAYVFVRSGEMWMQQAVLTVEDSEPGDYFGYSVGIDGDTAIVGALGKDNNSGAAYIFVRSGVTWSLQAKLTTPDAAPGSQFGEMVAISGDTVAINLPWLNQQRAIYIFTRSGSQWSQQARLTSPSNDAFCFSLDRNTLAVLSMTYTTVYVFARDGTTWNQQAQINLDVGSHLYIQSISIYGDILVFGLGIDFLLPSISLPSGTSNAIYISNRVGDVWGKPELLFKYDDTNNITGSYPVSVAAGANIIVAGFTRLNGNSGEVYVFNRIAQSWSQRDVLTYPDALPNDQFGSTVALDSNIALVGVTNRNCVYILNNLAPVQTTPVPSTTSQPPPTSSNVITGGNTLTTIATTIASTLRTSNETVAPKSSSSGTKTPPIMWLVVGLGALLAIAVSIIVLRTRRNTSH